MLRAVLDANVYISALLRPEGPPGRLVERFLREAAFEVVLTPAIVDEVLRVRIPQGAQVHSRRCRAGTLA